MSDYDVYLVIYLVQPYQGSMPWSGLGLGQNTNYIPSGGFVKKIHLIPHIGSLLTMFQIPDFHSPGGITVDCYNVAFL